MNDNKIIHFSHADDLDGKFCHMLTTFIYYPITTVDVHNDEMNTFIQNYIREHEDECKGADIIITDLGLKADSLKEIVELHKGCGRVIYIDHHPSMTREEMNEIDATVLIHNTGCSAAKLLHGFLVGSEVGTNLITLRRLHYVAQLVSDYDTFQFKDKGTYEAEWLNIYYHQYKDDFQNKLASMLTTERDIDCNFIKEMFYVGTCVEFKISARNNFIETKKKNIRIVNIDSLNVGLLFTDHTEYISEFGYTVCRELADRIDLMMFVSADFTTVSIRSCKENAADFAKSHGGGGHPNASGFTTTPEYIMELLELYWKYGVKAYLS